MTNDCKHDGQRGFILVYILGGAAKSSMLALYIFKENAAHYTISTTNVCCPKRFTARRFCSLLKVFEYEFCLDCRKQREYATKSGECMPCHRECKVQEGTETCTGPVCLTFKRSWEKLAEAYCCHLVALQKTSLCTIMPLASNHCK